MLPMGCTFRAESKRLIHAHISRGLYTRPVQCLHGAQPRRIAKALSYSSIGLRLLLEQLCFGQADRYICVAGLWGTGYWGVSRPRFAWDFSIYFWRDFRCGLYVELQRTPRNRELYRNTVITEAFLAWAYVNIRFMHTHKTYSVLRWTV